MQKENSQPIFVIGVARSGTTLLSAILDTHPEIAIPYESHFMPQYFRKSDEYDYSSLESKTKLVDDIFRERFPLRWDYIPQLTSEDLDSCSSLPDIINAIYTSYAAKKGKTIWGDKTPTYTENLHIINALFPKCRFVHLIRDGRDVSLSLLRQKWGPVGLIDCLRYWRECVTLGRRMGSMLPADRYIELKYESLVAQPEVEIRRLTSFLGLPFYDSMLSGYSTSIGDRIPSSSRQLHAKLKEGPDKDNASKWRKKMGKTDQTLANEYAGDALSGIGYPEGYSRAPRLIRLVRKHYWFIFRAFPKSLRPVHLWLEALRTRSWAGRRP